MLQKHCTPLARLLCSNTELPSYLLSQTALVGPVLVINALDGVGVKDPWCDSCMALWRPSHCREISPFNFDEVRVNCIVVRRYYVMPPHTPYAKVDQSGQVYKQALRATFLLEYRYPYADDRPSDFGECAKEYKFHKLLT